MKRKSIVLLTLIVTALWGCNKSQEEVQPPKNSTLISVKIVGKWQDGYSLIWSKKGQVPKFFYTFNSDSTFTCNVNPIYPDTVKYFWNGDYTLTDVHLSLTYHINVGWPKDEPAIFMDSVINDNGTKCRYYDTIFTQDQIRIFTIHNPYYPLLKVIDQGQFVRIE